MFIPLLFVLLRQWKPKCQIRRDWQNCGISIQWYVAVSKKCYRNVPINIKQYKNVVLNVD